MKISDAYPSKYLKADDLGQHRIALTVKMIIIEDIADKEYKPCMYFIGKEKGIVLNKTNAGLCAAVWGDETDLWQGKPLDLFAQPVMFQGRQVMGLAVAPKLPVGGTMATPSTPVQAVQQEAAVQNLTPAAASIATLANDIAAAEHAVDPAGDLDDLPF